MQLPQKDLQATALFQNLIVGGQNKDGEDVTNDLVLYVY